MTKYWLYARLQLQNYLIYRVNFIFWRFQVIISFITSYYLWQAVAEQRGSIGVYSLNQIYVYFIVGYLLRTLIFSTRTADIGGEIQSGSLSGRLLRPMGVIKSALGLDIVDKIFNLGFMTLEFGLIIYFLRPDIVLPSPANLLIFCFLTLIAILSFFFYSLVISFFSFWLDQAWSSRFLLGVVFVNLFSGQFIPLDFLPYPIVGLLKFTPYPYFFYYPLRFWLELEPPSRLLEIVIPSFAFLGLNYFLATRLWRRGLRQYQSYGH